MRAALTQALEALQWQRQIFTDSTLAQERDHELWMPSVNAAIAAAEAALAAQQEPVAPAGWVLVPAEATPEMIAALLGRTRFDNSWLPAYRTMLAAAPAAPTRQPLTPEQVKHIMADAEYETALPIVKAAFIAGIRQGELAHGIGDAA